MAPFLSQLRPAVPEDNAPPFLSGTASPRRRGTGQTLRQATTSAATPTTAK
eukprot:CAMPEP_0205934556 /NCGR_PEP_ID=MMETSP1325-20131115/36685_1 /ASSEMBLY_ACC=CAM_ASM_000708 /TAXON_ID=236786 /ORGANISM="Florenciella sp., Strain RCC1007" /LENGTH=50 /DNA_ID=CAMNT_0053304551 /DNA_START=114 /DNA_END=263 /DNA_ORIENTATION=+